MTYHVLLSGGMDSALAFRWAVENRGITEQSPHAWSVDYGQAHARELDAADEIAAGLRHDTLRTRVPWARSGDVVQGRNLFLLNLVASHAVAHAGACVLVVGTNAADLDGFPDCRPSFLDAAAVAISRGLGVPVRIFAPFATSTKADLVRWAKARPERWSALAQSWTCYVGGAVPCGECSACLKRAQGFAEAGELDPWTR